MVRVLIKKLDPKVTLPSYKTKGASGMDLMAFVKEKIVIKPQTSALIPTGLSVAFSEDYEIQIRPRSGLAAKNNISVLNNLAILKQRNSPKESISLYKKILSINKNIFEVRYNLSQCYSSVGKILDAKIELKKILNINQILLELIGCYH